MTTTRIPVTARQMALLMAAKERYDLLLNAILAGTDYLRVEVVALDPDANALVVRVDDGA